MYHMSINLLSCKIRDLRAMTPGYQVTCRIAVGGTPDLRFVDGAEQVLV
jgi:hypothetical protein